MFDIGFWELVILFGLGLIVLGPERLPKVAIKIGRWVGRARNMARHLSNQIRDEIEPFESGLNSVNEAMREDLTAKRPMEPAAKGAAESGDNGDTAKTDAPKADSQAS